MTAMMPLAFLDGYFIMEMEHKLIYKKHINGLN